MTLVGRRASHQVAASMAASYTVAIGGQEGFSTGGVPTMLPLGPPVVLRPGRQASFYHRELRNEWITELADDDWRPALTWAQSARTRPPDRSIFEWDRIAADHFRMLDLDPMRFGRLHSPRRTQRVDAEQSGEKRFGQKGCSNSS